MAGHELNCVKCPAGWACPLPAQYDYTEPCHEGQLITRHILLTQETQDVYPMLAQHIKWWAKIKYTLGEHFLFAGLLIYLLYNYYLQPYQTYQFSQPIFWTGRWDMMGKITLLQIFEKNSQSREIEKTFRKKKSSFREIIFFSSYVFFCLFFFVFLINFFKIGQKFFYFVALINFSRNRFNVFFS